MPLTAELGLCFRFSFLLLLASIASAAAPPYLSPAMFSPSYRKMLKSFKIFVYSSDRTFNLKSPEESLFHASLLNSSLVTPGPEEADLFFIPLDSDLPTRSVSRVVRDLMMELPYWNRTLGADHFYISCSGIGYESDRNLVELKKNSIQVSCFPAPEGKFIPHKDITLPPFSTYHLLEPQALASHSVKYLGFVKHGSLKMAEMIDELVKDSDFMVEIGPSDGANYREKLGLSKFCLFDYEGDVSGIGEAMQAGCVPVVITGHPIQDLPLIDVLRWEEMVVFVGRNKVLGAMELKRALGSVNEDRYQRMRDAAMSGSWHFIWNDPAQPLDSFHLVMYQLWMRRHTIRYARRDLA